MDVRLVPGGREVCIHPWFHMRMNHSHVYCRLEESFLKRSHYSILTFYEACSDCLSSFHKNSFIAAGSLACSSKYWFSNADMMFCHGRGKKLDHPSEYSYQVKASSWGDNSHYLIIPEIMQVRSGKAWISQGLQNMLNAYRIRRIPEWFPNPPNG